MRCTPSYRHQGVHVRIMPRLAFFINYHCCAIALTFYYCLESWFVVYFACLHCYHTHLIGTVFHNSQKATSFGALYCTSKLCHAGIYNVMIDRKVEEKSRSYTRSKACKLENSTISHAP